MATKQKRRRRKRKTRKRKRGGNGDENKNPNWKKLQEDWKKETINKRRKKFLELNKVFRNKFIHIGTFGKPLGLKGEIRITMLTNTLHSFYELRPFFEEDQSTILNLQLLRMSKGNIVARFFSARELKYSPATT